MQCPRLNVSAARGPGVIWLDILVLSCKGERKKWTYTSLSALSKTFLFPNPLIWIADVPLSVSVATILFRELCCTRQPHDGVDNVVFPLIPKSIYSYQHYIYMYIYVLSYPEIRSVLPCWNKYTVFPIGAFYFIFFFFFCHFKYPDDGKFFTHR